MIKTLQYDYHYSRHCILTRTFRECGSLLLQGVQYLGPDFQNLIYGIETIQTNLSKGTSLMKFSSADDQFTIDSPRSQSIWKSAISCNAEKIERQKQTQGKVTGRGSQHIYTNQTNQFTCNIIEIVSSYS